MIGCAAKRIPQPEARKKEMQFTKMQGAGNDFVMLDATQKPFALSPERVRALCDRRFGVGCDQLLVVEKSLLPNVDFKYRIFNCSGGEVEMCGNGARCFAVFVRELGLTDKKDIACETMRGIIYPHIEDDGTVTVDMGEPCFAPADVGLVETELEQRAEGVATLYKISAGGVDNWLSIVSMGNPHAVRIVENVDTDLVQAVGGALQQTPLFAQQVNVGFLQIVDRREVKLRVYERGAGETLACGTGACAAVVSGIRRGLLEADVLVHMRGGDIRVRWDGQGADGAAAHVYLSGPAVTVFKGEIDPEAIELPQADF